MDKHIVIGARKDQTEFTADEASRLVVLRQAAKLRELNDRAERARRASINQPSPSVETKE